MLKEKPNDTEWNALNEQKLPILSNYSLCKFHLKAYYECIEHTSTILGFQPRNVKALFRRGKANIEVWNVKEARRDMELCREIEPGLSDEIDIQLKKLDDLLAKKQKEEFQKYKGKLFT